MNRSNDIYRRRINQVIDHLNNNLNKPISLDELASVAYFSPFHFHRIFLAMTGETVNAFTNRQRNEKAARLLRFSKKPISFIAAECGFSSASTLSRSFKQYFAVSPSGYRSGEKIKNSKIRKDLQPLNGYYCEGKSDDLESLFPVKILRLKERKIAYIRVTNAFKEGVVISAFQLLIDWAKDAGLFESQMIFGMSKDDPEVTAKEKYTYEVCITLPEDFKTGADSQLQMTLLPACQYAFTQVSGDINAVAAGINYLFDTWLINSDYECETQPGLEVFLDKDNVCNWNHFDLEIGIPIKALTKF